MLHKNPELVSPATLDLVRQLQSLPVLTGFCLVGGTALTLQLGHRNSIDIDLFSQNPFAVKSLIEKLKEKFSIQVDIELNNTLLSRVNNIKVDFIAHKYAYVKEPLTEDGITFLSKEDIAAMKLSAISQSGKRLKDFIDIYFLLAHFSLTAMIEFFKIKYPGTNELIPLRAINYFDDIDENMDVPKMLKPLPIKEIKKRIQDATLHPRKIY